MLEIEYYKKAFKEINDRKWIEWEHKLAKTSIHCLKCQVLDKCWFLDNNKPNLPQHINCHCTVNDILPPLSDITSFAECPINKFEKFIFSDEYNRVTGKKDLFENGDLT